MILNGPTPTVEEGGGLKLSDARLIAAVADGLSPVRAVVNEQGQQMTQT